MKRFQLRGPMTSFFITLMMMMMICVDFVVCRNSRGCPMIFNFGDSNSDTGGMVAATGTEYRYPHGRAFFGRPMGRASDGRVLIDFLCESVGSKLLKPYLDSMDMNFASGVNFAVSGGCALPRDTLFNLNVQILHFKRFYNRSMELHSTGMTIMAGEENFKNALYVFDIGGNDLSILFSEPLSYTEFLDKIPPIISEIKEAILAIYQLGGKNFWVHNTSPAGCLPRQLAIRANNNATYDEYDEHGCIKSMNEGAKAFNAKLYDLCQELRSEMKDSNIVYVDIYSIKYDLVANAPSYGFENPLMACCGYGGPPYNSDPSVICSGGKYTVCGVICSGGKYMVCEKGKRYLSWDGTHCTDYANAIIASKILSTNYSTPPLKFNFFCNNARTLSASS